MTFGNWFWLSILWFVLINVTLILNCVYRAKVPTKFVRFLYRKLDLDEYLEDLDEDGYKRPQAKSQIGFR